MPTFTQFLILESDFESSDGQTFQITPDEPAVDDDAMAARAELDGDAQQEGPSLDTDERFLELPQSERFRIKQLAAQVSPPELEHELQTTWERLMGNKSTQLAPMESVNPKATSLLSQLLKL